MSPKKTGAKKTGAKKAATKTGFTAEEREAMKARAREARKPAGANDEAGVLAAIAKMPPPDRAIATRIHEIVNEVAPGLTSRTWYGMPAYAKDGKVVCFFQAAAKFKARYATLGFSDQAALDQGAMWATSFAVTALTDDEEKKIRALVKKAVR